MKENTGAVLTDQFNQLGGVHNGPPMPLVSMKPNRGVTVPLPDTGIAGSLKVHNPDRDFQYAKQIFPGGMRVVENDHSQLARELSPGIQAKANLFEVGHIVGRHKHQSSFVGGAGLEISKLHPGELTAYHNFLGSLSPQEQNEYGDWLGFSFGNIFKAVGNAAKAVGHAVGSAATAVAHVARDGAVAVGHVGRAIVTPIGHVARSIGLGVAHVSRDIGVGAAHFTAKNWPYLAAAAALFIPGLGPEVAAGVLGFITSMKASGASDAQIDQALQDQGYPGVFGSDGGAYDPNGFDPTASDPNNPENGDTTTDANGNIVFADGSTWNPTTHVLTTPDGKTNVADMPGMLPPVPKKTNWLLWGGIALMVAAVGYYLYKHKKLNFKFLHHK
jgi:LPXTG-motif cell wall-anchored protein